MPMLLGLVALMILMFWWTGRARRKQEAKRKELLSSLKKGDKIVTIGGIIGTVIEIRENEVTVKTDESNNVRMKFARWAVREVGEGPKGDVAPDDRK
jgi:preprotein translocase subunit YajC